MTSLALDMAAALACEDLAALENIQLALESLSVDFQRHSGTEQSVIAESASNCHLLSQTLLALVQENTNILQDMRADVDNILNDSEDVFTDLQPLPAPIAKPTLQPRRSPSQSDDFTPCRNFFISHLCNPYPSASEFAELQQLCPQKTLKQIRTFFINTRRRSGWNSLFSIIARRYENDLDRAKALETALTAQGLDDELAKAVRTVLAFFEVRALTKDQTKSDI